MSLRLDLLRHGATLGNGGFRGRLDDPLSELGWTQLRAAVSGQGPWSGLVSSPLQRCAAFAGELAAQQQLPLALEPDLRELEFGDWEGRTAAELMTDQSEALGRFWNDPYAFTPPGGEPVIDFETRVLRGIGHLATQRAGERLLVVTHAGVIRLLLARARGLPRERLLEVEVSHAALFGLHAAWRDDRLWLEEIPCSPC